MVALCRPRLSSLLVIDTHGRRQGLSRDLLKKKKYFCIHVFVFLFIVIQAILAGLNTNHFGDWYGNPAPTTPSSFFLLIVREKDIYATSWIFVFNFWINPFSACRLKLSGTTCAVPISLLIKAPHERYLNS